MTMIYNLKNLIPSLHCGAEIRPGVWVRAMHLQFYEGWFGRIGSAWEVLMDRAVAVKWPVDGEFEEAIEETNKR